MATVFNKEKYTVKIKDVYIPIDNNYIEFDFVSGENEVTEYELVLLNQNSFFKKSIDNKKSPLSLKVKKKESKKKIDTLEVDDNDSKPIGELKINLEE